MPSGTAPRRCTVAGCTSRHYGRGLCRPFTDVTEAPCLEYAPSWFDENMDKPRLRILRNGEIPPDGVEPKRYVGSDGYAYLRWRVAPGEYVQCLEHRWVMGLPPAPLQVHHINQVKDDNRPENLMVVTPAAHGAEHRTIDRTEACRLYAEGLSTVEIGERMGRNHAAVYRAIRSTGMRMRSRGEALRSDVRDDVIRDLHAADISARRIAKYLGVSPALISARMKELGLRTRPAQRPTARDERRMDRFMAAYCPDPERPRNPHRTRVTPWRYV